MRTRLALLLTFLVAFVSAGCGSAKLKGRTITFSGGGAFPPSTIVGSYNAGGCANDAETLVHDSHDFYAHSTYAPGPADLYYDEMRLDLAHFEADECTSAQLGQAMRHGLNPRARTFLLRNVASDLNRAFRAALDTTHP